MNIYKFLKPMLPVIMALSTGMLIAGCSSSGDDAAAEGAPPPVPTDGINGIWTGTFSLDTTGKEEEFDVTMIFYTATDAEEGTTGGAGFDVTDTTDPAAQFLFEGGYQYSADPIESDPAKEGGATIVCEGDVWAVGRFGEKGTFLQEFDYETGSAAGPDQRGAGCFYLKDNKLTGTIQFEDLSKLNVDLTYSTENTRSVSVSDLGLVATDDIVYHLWSNDNGGNNMTYTADDVPTADTVNITVIEDRLDTVCGGNVKVTKVVSHNLFTLQTNNDVSGCTVLDPPVENVDLSYQGLGALLDFDGDLKFVHLMASRGGGSGDTAQALYNRFTITTP